MKIVVKSTKTISFDENYEDDGSDDHSEESDDQDQPTNPENERRELK